MRGSTATNELIDINNLLSDGHMLIQFRMDFLGYCNKFQATTFSSVKLHLSSFRKYLFHLNLCFRAQSKHDDCCMDSIVPKILQFSSHNSANICQDTKGICRTLSILPIPITTFWRLYSRKIAWLKTSVFAMLWCTKKVVLCQLDQLYGMRTFLHLFW